MNHRWPWVVTEVDLNSIHFSRLSFISIYQLVQVVTFEGDLLLQGRDNRVKITLLKQDITDSTLETYTYRQFRACSISESKRKGKGFKAASQQTSNPKVCIVNVQCNNFKYLDQVAPALHSIKST